MRTPKRLRKLGAPLLVVTANWRNFLRVNAQMYNLDKQKTHASWQYVGGHSKDDYYKHIDTKKLNKLWL